MAHAYQRHAKLGRDRVSNGRLFGRGVDLRSASARRFRYLVNLHAAAFGDREIGPAETNLIRQCAALQVQAETLQEKIVRGEVVNTAELVAAAAGAERLLDILKDRILARSVEGGDGCAAQSGKVDV
jgi:hypothetical protein